MTFVCHWRVMLMLRFMVYWGVYSRVAFGLPSRRPFFPDSLLGEIFRNFANRLHSTMSIERYREYKRFWAEHTFFSRQSWKKNVEIWGPKKYFKNNFGSKKSWGKFSPRLSKHYSFLELWLKMTLGLSISRAVMVLFLIFTQIIIQICTVTWPYSIQQGRRSFSFAPRFF